MTEARKRAQKKYDQSNTKRYYLKLNIKTDADIIAKLDSVENKQAFIKECLRKG